MSRANGHRTVNGEAQPCQESQGHWRRADTIPPRTLEWLLPGRITRGGLTTVEGATSVGKSTFLAHLVAAVTTGIPWLGRPRSKPADVLWLTGEEDFGSAVRTRLVSAEADLAHVHSAPIDVNGEPQRLRLPAAIGALRVAVQQLDLALIVMEPLSSFVGPEVDLNNVTATRAVLDPLQQMSLATRASVIVTRGLRKDRSGPRLSHGQGSSAISDTARNVIQIDCADVGSPSRTLVTAKVAGGQLPSAVRYEIRSSDLGPVMAGLRDLSAAELAESDQVNDLGERSAMEDARAMLRTMLTGEWLPVSVILAACQSCGISVATLRRAERQLGVRKQQSWDGSTNRWDWAAPEGGFAQQGGIPENREHQGHQGKSAVKKPRKKRA